MLTLLLALFSLLFCSLRAPYSTNGNYTATEQCAISWSTFCEMELVGGRCTGVYSLAAPGRERRAYFLCVCVHETTLSFLYAHVIRDR